jgi:alpha-N-acetylglucosamine transferase
MNSVTLDDSKYQGIDNPNDISGIIKMGDLKYYNYALEADAINQLFRTGLKNVKLDVNKETKYTNLNMLSSYELEKNEIKEL